MNYPGIVKVWLFIGLIMVFIQIVVGGITRLTESGLSITKWEVVSGTLPPLTEESWVAEFEKYKDTPQYREINEGMTMSDFKFIYFWEYIHRLWARFMGFVFLVPFCIFYYKGWLDKVLLKKLSVVIVFAMLAAVFGWIMVASGLVDRPWVNAYKLSIHLLIAVSVFVSLEWALLGTLNISNYNKMDSNNIIPFYIFSVLLIFQLVIGGILSGMKAAVVYPTWPDLNGVFLPDILTNPDEWKLDNFLNYDRNSFMPALIHFIHRNTAYCIAAFGLYLSWILHKVGKLHRITYFSILSYLLIISIFIQAVLGIITVIKSKGSIPVIWGVLHQGGAIILISIVVLIIFLLKIKKVG